MKEAYDNILQTTVTAEDAAANRGFEPYRFECPYCGEEVRIAAPFSTMRGAHFRHLHGNNDTECEEYYGIGAEALSGTRNRGSFREVANIIYNCSTNTFMLRIKFSEDEIVYYESKGTFLEIRTADNENLKRVAINHKNFAPDVYTRFILDRYSKEYKVAIEGKKIRNYSFVSFEKPELFKIQGDDDNYDAKKLSSFADTPVIYTRTRYLVVTLSSSGRNQIKTILKHAIIKSFQITTMKGKIFYAYEIEIEKHDNQLEQNLLTIGYRLEKSDSVVLLWPPAYADNDSLQCASEEVFIYSSFPVRPHCGNNLDVEDIRNLDDNLSLVSVEKGAKIIRKNTEMQIYKTEWIQLLEKQEPVITYGKVHTVSKEGTSIMFDHDGSNCLAPGQLIHMSPGRIIKRYQNNMVVEIICPESEKALSRTEIVIDAEKYYKRGEDLNNEYHQKDMSSFAKNYIDTHTNHCNLAVIKMIEEGKI